MKCYLLKILINEKLIRLIYSTASFLFVLHGVDYKNYTF